MVNIIDALYMDFPQEARETLKIRYRFHALLHQNNIILYPDARGVIEALKDQNYLLGIATGKSASSLQRDLTLLKLSSWFDATRTADQTFSKPHPQILQEIMELLRVSPQRTLFVGDGILDMQTAENAHVDAVGVHPKRGQQTEFIKYGAKAVFNTLTELLVFLA
jgi:phosphoglycolate phosphatase